MQSRIPDRRQMHEEGMSIPIYVYIEGMSIPIDMGWAFVPLPSVTTTVLPYGAWEHHRI